MAPQDVLVCDPNARARIPGTDVVSYKDCVGRNGDIEIEVHRLKAGDQVFHLDFLRPMKMAPNGHFILGRVTDEAGERAFWNFSQEGLPKKEFRARVCVDPLTGEHFIAVVNCRNYRHQVLERVILIRDLPATKMVTIAGDEVVRIGGALGFQELIEIKKQLVKELGISGYSLNPLEKKFVEGQGKIEAAQRAARRAEEVAAEEAEKAKRMAEKQARFEARAAKRQEIRERGSVTVFTREGRRLYGYPATGEEWPVLNDRTFVVLVKEYPAEPLEVISCFIVEKKVGGRLGKKNEVFDLTLKSPVRQAEQPQFSFIGGFMIEKDGQPIPVLETDKANFEAMVKNGMNNDTLVAIADVPSEKDGRRQIYRFAEGGVQTLGMFVPLC